MSSKTRLLWVCAGTPATEDTAVMAALEGFEIEVFPEIGPALSHLRSSGADAVLATLPIPGWTAEETLEELQRAGPSAPILIREVNGSFDRAVRLARLGARYYFGAALCAGDVARRIEAAVEERRSGDLASLGEAIGREPWRRWLVGESRAVQNVIETIRLVGPRRSTVLITGETGTGKEMAARALHLASPRARLPMVTVNCSALPEHLLEAELFGHVRGAFTGAIQSRIGRFEQADGSTLFLDEIGDMPLELQAKLLRVLQEREFQRLGSSETVRVDVRVAAASNSDLPDKVRRGQFREDLYYRINVVPVEMPPLRERLADVPLLVLHFIEKICRLENIPAKEVRSETLDRLSSYSWPGNVRQLENAVEMAVALSGQRPVLYPSDFPLPSPVRWKPSPCESAPSIAVPDHGLDFDEVVGRFEQSILDQAMRKSGGNKKRAADLLRLKRTTLSAKLRTFETRAGCSPN
jgi:DNA-binding NtrC family response regulator